MEKSARKRQTMWLAITGLALVISITTMIIFPILLFFAHLESSLQDSNGTESWCLLPNASTFPDRVSGLKPSLDFAANSSIRKQVERLSAAVRVPTESWDDNGDVGVDPRWKIFAQFHSVLHKQFPLVYVEALIG